MLAEVVLEDVFIGLVGVVVGSLEVILGEVDIAESDMSDDGGIDIG